MYKYRAELNTGEVFEFNDMNHARFKIIIAALIDNMFVWDGGNNQEAKIYVNGEHFQTWALDSSLFKGEVYLYVGGDIIRTMKDRRI